MSSQSATAAMAVIVLAGCSEGTHNVEPETLPQSKGAAASSANTQVRFGTHGISTTVPQREYAEVRLAHYHGDPKNLDLSIYTCNLSNREDQGEGLLLRYSPALDTYSPHIRESTNILRNRAEYTEWSLPRGEDPYNLTSLLTTLGLKPVLKHRFMIQRGEWHCYDAYYVTEKGVYAISVWDDEQKPIDNPRITEAFRSLSATPIE